MTKEKVKIDNPFVTTGYAGAEYFCDREKETADIIRYLTNGNHRADMARVTCCGIASLRRLLPTIIIRLLSTSIPPRQWRRW